jgi:transcription elongation factor Elf1
VPERDDSHFSCPFCNSYDVNRLFIATSDVDSCECSSCGARWDEEHSTGKYLGRAGRASVLAPRQSR